MRRTIAVLAVLVFVSLYPVPSKASTFLVDRIFWSGCGPGRTIVGEIFTDCDGSTDSWGITTDYEERWVEECETGRTWHFYIQCGSSVSSLDTCYC